MRKRILLLSLLISTVSLLGPATGRAATVLITYDVTFFQGELEADTSFQGWMTGRQFTVAYQGTGGGAIQSGSAVLQTADLLASRTFGGGSYFYASAWSFGNLAALALQATVQGGFSNPTASAPFQLHTQFSSGGPYFFTRRSTTRTVLAQAMGVGFAVASGTGPIRLVGTFAFQDPGGYTWYARNVEGVEVSRTVIPQPGTGWLLGSGLVLLGVARRHWLRSGRVAGGALPRS